MQVSLEVNPGSYAILAYEPGEITINLPADMSAPAEDISETDDFNIGTSRHERFNNSLIISPAQLIRDWPPQSFDELKTAHFSLLTELQPEIILLGTGDILRWPEPALLSPLYQEGIGVEIMDTAAACRTYNILMADARNFVAALLMK